MNWSGLVLLVAGLAALVGSEFLIRHRAENHELMVAQQQQIFGSRARKLSPGGSSAIFLVLGLVGVLVGVASAVFGVLALVGVLQTAY
jgi:hypothetical protein